MKKLLAILVIILTAQSGYAQLNMNQLFNEFRKENNVTSVNIGKITLKLASIFTETMGVDGIEVLDFSDCAQNVKERLSCAIKDLKDPDYDTMVTTNENNSRTKILVNIKEDVIREMVILTSGDGFALVRIKGKIKPSDIERVVNEHKHDGR